MHLKENMKRTDSLFKEVCQLLSLNLLPRALHQSLNMLMLRRELSLTPGRCPGLTCTPLRQAQRN